MGQLIFSSVVKVCAQSKPYLPICVVCIRSIPALYTFSLVCWYTKCTFKQIVWCQPRIRRVVSTWIKVFIPYHWITEILIPSNFCDGIYTTFPLHSYTHTHTHTQAQMTPPNSATKDSSAGGPTTRSSSRKRTRPSPYDRPNKSTRTTRNMMEVRERARWREWEGEEGGREREGGREGERRYLV